MSAHSPRPKLLVCDDDPLIHLTLKTCLSKDYDLTFAIHTDEAIKKLNQETFDLLILDIQIRTDREGLEQLPRLKQIDSDLPIILFSGRKDFDTVREALSKGASDYLPKDFDPNEIKLVLERVLDKKKLLLKSHQRHFETQSEIKKNPLIGNHPSIQKLRETIEKIKKTQANVLITGETGTGKEVVARQLRLLKNNEWVPFIAVDSSTIQNTMAESILFGHERGAFTGADHQTRGVFEEANGGIVYFDEISNMPLDVQAKLLRVVQEKQVTRLGSTRVIPVQFQIVAATNKNLEKQSEEGRFKFDLYQRLNVIPIELLPLRKRIEDLPLLLEHFLENERKRNHHNWNITPEALDFLKLYSWPGNIRELENLVSYLVTMTDHECIDVSDLPPKLRDHIDQSHSDASSFYEQVSQFEATLLKKSYQELGANVSKMALQLGMDRSHLYSKLKNYGIHATRST